MTITIAYRVQDGLVIGTDSFGTSLTKDNTVERLYSSADKIVEIGPHQAYFRPGEHFSGCVAFFGSGSFDKTSWRQIMNEFYLRYVFKNPVDPTPHKALHAFLRSKWNSMMPKQQLPPATLVVATIQPGEVEITADTLDLQKDTLESISTGHPVLLGYTDVISQLWDGCHPTLKESLIIKQMVTKKHFEEIVISMYDTSTSKTSPYRPDMPLRNAIDFVHFMLYTTINTYQYRAGVMTVGGKIDIVTLTPDCGFQRVLHKSLEDAIGT